MGKGAAEVQFEQGVKLAAAGRADEALGAFAAALEVAPDAESRARIHYNIAACRAAVGDVAGAVAAAREAVGGDRSLRKCLRVDVDFDPLRGDAAFAELVGEAPRPAAPVVPRPVEPAPAPSAAVSAPEPSEVASPFAQRFNGWFVMMSLALGAFSFLVKVKQGWTVGTWLRSLAIAVGFAAAWGVFAALSGIDPPGRKARE